MMTRADFTAIANALHSVRPAMPPQDSPTRAEDHHLAMMLGWVHAVAVMADTLARANPRFDRDKFLLACGVMPTNVTLGAASPAHAVHALVAPVCTGNVPTNRAG